MSDLDRQRTGQEARRHAGDARRIGHTRYAEAIGRYLGSFGYETVGGVTVHHRVDGVDPVAALAAASDRAAALVVGRRGRGGVTGALLGSVSRSVLQHARCPVFRAG